MFRHLYVHVPFCRRRCSYCDFAIAVRRQVPAADYVAAVGAEIEAVCQHRPASGAVETIYLGGGTPSLLPPAAVVDLLSVATRAWPLAPGVEITLEANPEDVTPTAARTWREAGVNRVSLGAQSFDGEALRWMHRPHGPEAPRRAARHLREAGIHNLSVDLIFALPESLRRNWQRDLDLAIALDPDHVSLYGLTVEPRTPLARWMQRGEVACPPTERYAEEYLLAHEVLGRAGFEFYEVSNAARAARWSRHNLGYWLEEAYLGLGPAAHSYLNGERWWNVEAWEAYRRAVGEGRPPVAGREQLDTMSRDLERVYLALRTARGLPGRAVPDGTALAWCRSGWATTEAGRLRLTPAGWLVMDELVLDLTAHRGTS